MSNVVATVFSADNIFAKEAEIEQMNSIRILESRNGLGKFSFWARATPGNLNTLVKQSSPDIPRVVVIKLKDSEIGGDNAHSKRNYIKGQATSTSFSSTGFVGTSLVWLPSSDSRLQLSGKHVTFSFKASSAAAVTGTRCKVKLVYKHLPDSATLTDGEMLIDILSTVSVTPKRYSVTARLPDIGLQQLGVSFDFAGLSSAVTISEAKLELGKVATAWALAPEDTGSMRSTDTYAGIISRVSLEDGNNFKGLVVEGFLMEQILDYRCIWKMFTYAGTLRGLCQEVIDTQLINPVITERAIPNLVVEIPLALTEYAVNIQKTGGSVSDLLFSSFADTRYGISAVHDYITGKVRLYVYEGKSRTASQSILPPVVFTRKNGLLISPQYEKDFSTYKNVALVAGAGEGAERAYQTAGVATGWSRKEVFIDARDLQQKDDSGTAIALETYLAQLLQRGNEKLAGYAVVENFTSDVNTSVDGYVYNRDYFIGDTVTLYDDLYGMSLDAPIESVETNITPTKVSRKLQFGVGMLTLNQKLRLRFN